MFYATDGDNLGLVVAGATTGSMSGLSADDDWH